MPVFVDAVGCCAAHRLSLEAKADDQLRLPISTQGNCVYEYQALLEIYVEKLNQKQFVF
jgi:hypothetical protein